MLSHRNHRVRKNRRTKTVVTARNAKTITHLGGKPLRSKELMGLPLEPTRPGGSAVWLPWRDQDGKLHMSQSDSGIVEVRISEFRISWASNELEDAFIREYSSFKRENCSDTSQDYSICARLPHFFPDGARKMFILHGNRPTGALSCMCRSPYLMMLFGLNWISQVWCVAVLCVLV